MAKRTTRSARTSSRPSARSRSAAPARTPPVPTSVPLPEEASPAAAAPYKATCRALLVHAAPAERDDARAQAIAEAAVREVLDTTDRELRVVLAELGDELLFHVATNPEVRRRVLKGAGPKKRGQLSAPRATPRGSVPRLPREGSRALLSRLA